MSFSATVPAGHGGESSPSRDTGFLFQWPGLCFLFGVLLLAAWADQAPIVLLVGLFLSAALLTKVWTSLCLNRVSCDRTFQVQRLFPGDSTELKIRIINRKPLPLPWFRIEQEFPLEMGGEFLLKPSFRPGYGFSHHEGALLWYSALRWKIRLTCNKRGYYVIGPMRLTSGDIFGFYSRSMVFSLPARIIVYPRIFSVGNLAIPSLQPMGESRTRNRIFRDPARAIGLRDYRYGDSLRHIHWKASARSRQMQVKVFEATTSFKAALFLSVESFTRQDSLDGEGSELAISTAASVAHHVVEGGNPVGLFVNTRSADSGHAVSVPPAGGRDQLPLLLEALAKVTPAISGPFEAFLDREREGLTAGTTLILLFGNPPESLPGWLSDLRASGYRILLLLVGEHGESPIPDGIAWRNIRTPLDFDRT